MSKSGNNKNIAQDATRLQKLAKVNARYLDMEQFRDSDLEVGYFSYNCIYFMKPNHCAIVADDGADAFGKTSNEIAPYHTAFVRYGNQINVK
jgi:hypothetical protein